MQRKELAIIAAVVLGAFASGLLLGRATAPNASGELEPNSQDIVAAEPRPGAGQTARRPFQEPRDEDAERPAPAEPDGFAYTRLRLDTGADLPKACFQFTRDLDQSGKTNYADYVRLRPDTGFAVEAAGSSLCVTGLNFNQDYRAQLRPGLPAQNGDQLARGEEVLVAFGDKPAYVGFAGNGVILPRLEADGIGIETVNVDKVKVTVHRVSDRSLARKNIVEGQATGARSYSYVWERENGEDVGVKVFEGEIAPRGDRNDTATTVFSLGAALNELKPGAYFVRLRDSSDGVDERRNAAQAWRWIVFTDMAISTYSGADGVDVFVRSIGNARAVAGVELQLIAENNELLASAITNGEGRARFGGAAVNGDYPQTPRMIMAYGPQDDFAALDLRRAPLDLSEFDVAGRGASSKIDGFVYLDRGVYRPGEIAHISGLLRDDAGNAIADRAATVIVKRPNGTEALNKRIDTLSVGGFSFSYTVPKHASRGIWSIIVQADGIDRQVGSASFSVEDFVPQRLEVTLDTDEKAPIRVGERRDVTISSRFLYGAPAVGLPVESEARLRLDPNPFPDFRRSALVPLTAALMNVSCACRRQRQMLQARRTFFSTLMTRRAALALQCGQTLSLALSSRVGASCGKARAFLCVRMISISA